MEQTPKEILKAYVDSQKFNSTTEIMDAMKEMFRDVLQQVMESELDTELGYEKSQRTSETTVENKPRNYRNGHSKKTVKTQLGAVEVKVPRDRNGEYEPQIIGKYSRNADGMEEKILGLYACGMSQRDISEQIKSLYDYKVKENHQYQTKAAYVVLGVTMDGTKDILGVWIGEHESSKFWLNVLNDLKSRGVLDVYLFCVDGLKGFVEAIGAVYPHSQVQRCIVHQIRSSPRFVSYIEGLNRQFRQITKNKPSFTSDDSLRKMLYLASRKIVEHWTARCRNWDMVLAQLQLMFQDRQTV